MKSVTCKVITNYKSFTVLSSTCLGREALAGQLHVCSLSFMHFHLVHHFDVVQFQVLHLQVLNFCQYLVCHFQVPSFYRLCRVTVLLYRTPIPLYRDRKVTAPDVKLR